MSAGIEGMTVVNEPTAEVPNPQCCNVASGLCEKCRAMAAKQRPSSAPFIAYNEVVVRPVVLVDDDGNELLTVNFAWPKSREIMILNEAMKRVKKAGRQVDEAKVRDRESWFRQRDGEWYRSLPRLASEVYNAAYRKGYEAAQQVGNCSGPPSQANLAITVAPAPGGMTEAMSDITEAVTKAVTRAMQGAVPPPRPLRKITVKHSDGSESTLEESQIDTTPEDDRPLVSPVIR